MLDESICHLGGVGSILSLLLYFLWKILLANNLSNNCLPTSISVNHAQTAIGAVLAGFTLFWLMDFVRIQSSTSPSGGKYLA